MIRANRSSIYRNVPAAAAVCGYVRQKPLRYYFTPEEQKILDELAKQKEAEKPAVPVVAGAIYSGFAMVLVLAIPIRRFYGVQDMITMRHLDNAARRNRAWD